MKKSFGILLAGMVGLFAQSVTERYHIDDIDVGLMYGLTSIDNSGGWDFSKHTLQASFLLKMQEFSVDPMVNMTFVNLSDEDGAGSLWQLALNGLYTFDGNFYAMTPYLYAGLGYEYVHNSTSDLESNPFLQAGVGVRYPLFNDTDLVGEFRGLHVLELSGSDQGDEFTLFIGVDIPLQEQYLVPGSKTVSAPLPESSAPELQMKRNDKDGDGVPDALDICPATPPHAKVNEHGCIPKTERSKLHTASASLSSVKAEAKTALQVPVAKSELSSRHLVLHPIFTGSTQMDEASRDNIRRLAKKLKNRSFKRITIEGYTDDRGDFEQNRVLSQKRADAVKKVLVSEGIAGEKIVTVGKGELSPIANNDTPEGRAQNRRIEITIE